MCCNFLPSETVPMREKEKILDYRFMPEPNLTPLVIHKDWSTTEPTRNAVVLEDIKSRVKDLPDDKRKCLEEKYQMSLRNAVILVVRWIIRCEFFTYCTRRIKCFNF